MKKICMMLFWLSSLGSYAQTNVYHPFPENNARWHGVVLSAQVPPFPGILSDFDYQLNGQDTIVNSISYKKITGISTSASKQLIGLRQDIPNKKVFGLDGNTLSEFLLYDFNLNIGDTIHFRPIVQCDSLSIVNSIDSIFIGGSYRKKFNLNLNVSLIEGIGSTSGLVEHNCFEGANLLCYFTNNIDTAFSDNTSPWLCKTNRTVDILKSIGISIYPNPCLNVLILKKDKECIIRDFSLNNSLGQVVYKTNFSSNEIKLDMKSYQKGLYYISFRDEKNFLYTSKILKE